MHELPFIILARRGDDDGNQESAQDVLHEAETWRQSHVQGPCCCGLDSESTNVHAYIDRAGRGGGADEAGLCHKLHVYAKQSTSRIRAE